MLHILSRIRDYGVFDLVKHLLSDKDVPNGMEFDFTIENEELPGTPWIVLLPWRTSVKEAKRLKLIPKKSPSYVYEGPSGIPNEDPSKVLALLDQLHQSVSSHQLERFNLLAYSVGNFAGFDIARLHPVERLVGVVPGSKLGESIWQGVRTQPVRRASERFGVPSSDQYDSVLDGVNPVDNAKHVRARVELHVAAHDFYIRSHLGEELIEALEAEHENVEVVRHKGKGHIQTLLTFANTHSL